MVTKTQQVRTAVRSTDLFGIMATKLKNGWNEGEATEDGVYLRAFDEWDDDEDGDEFQLIGGEWHKDGAPWVCYGGVWKRTGDLPNAVNS